MTAIALACCAWPVAAYAHDGGHDAPLQGMSGWDALAVGALIAAGVLYAAGQRRLARRGVPVGWGQWSAYWSGWVAMMAAILPPLDGLAAIRFSAHMVQHELLMLVGVPLMLAGRPVSVYLWALAPASRLAAARVLQWNVVSAVWRLLTLPVVAWALHGLAIWIWHVPALYETAVRHESVHALQHAMFVGSAVCFWWGLVYGRYGRVGYGASVFYVFTTVVHTGLLGAVFALTSTPLYQVYVERGPDPVEDQQVAGLVMWIPAGIVLTATGIALFAAWLGAAGRRPART